MKNKAKKHILPIFILLFLTLVFCGCVKEIVETENTSQANETKSQRQELFNVLHVVDGDTFSVRMNDEIEIVRVIGIDSPETGEKYTKRECFGRESTKKAIEILSGKKVSLESDPTQADRDEYDRLLRYVFFEDGTFYNQVMIEEGFAREYTFKGSKYKHQTDFLSVQAKAKQEKRGLWGACEDE